MQLFTTAEAAAYLRLKERKIYEMVAEGTVPCTKVTGRWLFPKAELDQWLAASVGRPAGMARPEPAPIVAGSHDPLLEWALRESGSGLATLAVGSEAGLARFTAGEAVAASMHLHALDDLEADSNVAAMQSRGDTQDAVLIAFCRREQGFLVAPGNPRKLNSIDDVFAKRARIAMRPKGAGAQLLLLALLHGAKAVLDQLAAVNPVAPTGPDIAQAIRAGRADTGIATRGVANAAGLDFVPIVWEHFDLAVRQRDYFHAPLQALIRFLTSDEFAARARTGRLRSCGGRLRALCDVSGTMSTNDVQSWPSELRLHKDRKTLTVSFVGGERFDLPAEYLRVKSPSAEVQGHSAEERKTVPGKREVGIIEVLPVGNYAVRLVFDDLHSTGIFGWDYLLELGRNRDKYWQDYIDDLAAKNLTRDPPTRRK